MNYSFDMNKMFSHKEKPLNIRPVVKFDNLDEIEDKVVEEEEWDLNKKHYINELRHSNFEKRIFVVSVIMFVASIYMLVFRKTSTIPDLVQQTQA